MKYNYNLTDKLIEGSASIRADLKSLGEKDKETDLPKIIVNSHEEMVSLLRKASKDNPYINQRALDAIEKFDRTDFFEWDGMPKEIKEKIVTPYCFMAPVFADGQTIPSPHIILTQTSILDLKDGQKILEIGAGSGYNAVIVAYTAGDNAKVYSTEIRPNLIKLGRENIKKLGLEDKVTIIEADKRLGFPENAPFDRIYSTVGAHTTSQTEELIDQLAINGLLMLPIARYGNTKNKEESKLWEPGMNIAIEDIYFKDPFRGFMRSATYLFRKDNENNVTYSVIVSNAIGPLLNK